MKTKLFRRIGAIFCFGVLGWEFFQARKRGEALMALATCASLFLFMGLLIAVDVYLAKRKTSAWMERYHVCLGIVLGGAIILFTLKAISASN